jgi:hypothetical protein
MPVLEEAYEPKLLGNPGNPTQASPHRGDGKSWRGSLRHPVNSTRTAGSIQLAPFFRYCDAKLALNKRAPLADFDIAVDISYSWPPAR